MAVFTLERAETLLPEIQSVTREAARRMEALANEMRELDEDAPELEQLDAVAREVVARWMREVTKLGAEPKGLWLVDFDAGDGYFCWEYPEEGIGFFHGYDTGIKGRQPIGLDRFN